MNGIRQVFMLFALWMVTTTALAQSVPPVPYPDRPIKVVVPFRSGGVVDVVARLVAQKLGEAVRQPVVVENRTGAGGNIGAEHVAKAAADGYTLLHTLNTIALSPALYRKLSFDPGRDLVPVIGVTSQPLVLAISPSLPVKSVKELIEYAKARPGKLFFGSSGVGNFDHLAGELFNVMAMINIVHVPYKDNSQSLADLMAGRLTIGFIGMADAPLVRSGKLRGLAVTSSKRARVLPDLSTISEAGLPQYEVVNSNGIYVPAATPKPLVNRLNDEILKILNLSEIQARFNALGLETIGGSPEQLAKELIADIAKWKQVVEKAGIKPAD